LIMPHPVTRLPLETAASMNGYVEYAAP
jgi:hypothetical protein